MAKLQRGAGRPAARKDVVGHAGIDQRRVLLGIVQGQALHCAAEDLPIDELVKADFERGFHLTQRSEKPFLADADLGVGFAVHSYSRLKPSEDIIRRAVEAVGTDEYIRKGPRLTAQAIPILGSYLNTHVEHAVEGEVGVAGMGGVRIAKRRTNG